MINEKHFAIGEWSTSIRAKGYVANSILCSVMLITEKQKFRRNGFVPLLIKIKESNAKTKKEKIKLGIKKMKEFLNGKIGKRDGCFLVKDIETIPL